MGIITGTPNSTCCFELMNAEKEFYGMNVPSNLTTQVGVLEALKSQKNGGVYAIQDGKEAPTKTSTRKAKIEYYTRECSVGTDTALTECTIGSGATSTSVKKTADIAVTGAYSFEIKFDEAEYKSLCENPTKGFADLVAVRLDQARAEYNQAVATQLVSLMGEYPVSGDSSVLLPQAVYPMNTSGMYSPQFMSHIIQHYRKMKVTDKPIMVGGSTGKLGFAIDTRNYAGLNQAGIQLSGGDTSGIYLDDTLNDLALWTGLNAGKDHLLTWAPRTIRLVEVFDNVGDYQYREMAIINGQERPKKEKSIIDLGGERWDFFMQRDDCGLWTYGFSKKFEVIGIPQDAFASCQTGNLSLHFIANCDDYSCTNVSVY